MDGFVVGLRDASLGLCLVHTVIAVVAEGRELLGTHADVIEGLALGILDGSKEGAGELDVPRTRIGILVEDLDVVDPQAFVELDGKGRHSVVLTLLRSGGLVQPDLAVGDHESVEEGLATLDGALHDSSLSRLAFLP